MITSPDLRARRSRRRWWLLAVALVLIIIGVWFAPSFIADHFRRLAEHHLQLGNISAVLEDVQSAGRFDGENAADDLLRCACYRRRGDQEAFAKSIDLAKQHGAATEQIQAELDLAAIRQGGKQDLAEYQLADYIAKGLSSDDVAAAFVQGFIAQKRQQEAENVLAAWEDDAPQSADLFYARGIFWAWRNDYGKARAAFERSLGLSPDHEMARMGLAEMYERQEQWELALVQFDWLAGRSATNWSARLGLARMLRKTGRIDAGRRVLQKLVDVPSPVHGLAIEAGELAFDANDDPAAVRWFDRVDLDGAQVVDTLRAAAMAYQLSGNTDRANSIFQRIDTARRTSMRSQQLMDRITFDPSDQAATAEYRHLTANGSPPAAAADGSVPPELLPEAAALYTARCVACHGADGRGTGRAARHLFPPPRDLRRDRLRLVTTTNGRPSKQDIRHMLRTGIPGTSMRAFDDLDDRQLDALSRQVMHFQVVGARERYVDALTADGEECDDEEAQQFAERATTPGPELQLPSMPAADADAIARGKVAYREFTCYNCHGEDGTGAADVPLYNDDQSVAWPRDLVFDPMKGGNDAAGLFRRLRLGMPGTPHPSCPTATDQQLIDLVHYCQSLGKEPKRRLTGRELEDRADQRALVADFLTE